MHEMNISGRIGLGIVVLHCLIRFKHAVAGVFGKSVASWMMFITASQFHFIFYMSRPLPNTFALALGTSWIIKRSCL